MQLLRDYLFLIPLAVMLASEITKALVHRARTGQWIDGLFRPGGMPSTHSAFVTSLLIVVGQKLGVQSTEFAIAFVFACVVWYDAMSVRREVGQQAVILNKLQKRKHFREQVGHSFLEVTAGIGFGAIVTLIGIQASFHPLVANLLG